MQAADETQGAAMWVLVLAIVIGVVVLATGMRSSVDEAWIGQRDGDPPDLDGAVADPPTARSAAPHHRADQAA